MNDKYLQSIRLIQIILFMILISTFSCDQDKKEKSSQKSTPRIRKKVEQRSPEINAKFALGQEISFEFAHKNNLKIDSVKFENDNENVTFGGNTFSWKPKFQRTGIPLIKATIFFGDEQEILYPKIKILAKSPPTEYTYHVVAEYKHDNDAFTQGLFFIGNTMVESTGLRGKSDIRLIDLNNNNILSQVNLEKKYFGEGATFWKDKIFQLTWESQTALEYDKDLNFIRSHNYTGEGWGLTTYGDLLIKSDGTENLYFLDPRDFSEVKKLQAYDNKGKVDLLNELEVIEGRLFANIYNTNDEIVIIDLETGAVIGKINFKGLLDRNEFASIDYALNGIAYHPDKRIFITGKLWPKIFEVEIIPINRNL